MLALRRGKITNCTNPPNALITLVVFIGVTVKLAPLRQLGRAKQKQPEWFSNKLKNLKNDKNFALRSWKGIDDNNLSEKFKKLRIDFEKQCCAAKKKISSQTNLNHASVI